MAIELVYSVSDDDGDIATTSINLPSGFSLANYGEFAASMATIIDAILHGRLESAEVCFGVDLSALLNNLTGTTSDVEEIGAFVFDTNVGTKVGINLPGLDEAFVGSGSDDINQASPAVAAFITAMEGGITVTGGTISPCDVGEAGITSVVSARERFRASGSRA